MNSQPLIPRPNGLQPRVGPEPALRLAGYLAARLGTVEGVVAVVLGGSWARGSARPDSDVDIGILYEPAQPPDLVVLRQLAEEMDDRHLPDLLTPFGGWGPWINGGGWLEVQRQRVDWIYRDLNQVRRVIEECRSGHPTLAYQAGHPHGFHSHIYLAELHYCQVLHDPGNVVAALKEQVSEYPPPLKTALVERFLWEANFALGTAQKPASRGEVQYVAGCLYRCVACMVQVLYALNERYFSNEKGSVQEAAHLPRTPIRFEETVTRVLSEPGADAARLRASIAEFEQLVRVVEELSSVE